MGKNHCHSPHTLINLPISSIFVVQIQTLSLSAFPISYLSIFPASLSPRLYTSPLSFKGSPKDVIPLENVNVALHIPECATLKNNAMLIIFYDTERKKTRNIFIKGETSYVSRPKMQMFLHQTWYSHHSLGKVKSTSYLFELLLHIYNAPILHSSLMYFTYHFNSHW